MAAPRRQGVDRHHNRALELGINFFDTADVYGPHINEELVGRASATIAAKSSLPPSSASSASRTIRPSAASTAAPNTCTRPSTRASSGSVSTTWTCITNIASIQRCPSRIPSSDGRIGQSRQSAIPGPKRSLAGHAARRKVHPITAVQSEYSLWTRDPEAEVITACRDLGVGFVPYSPLGRGFLSGGIARPEDLSDDDFRRRHPRFEGDNFAKNANSCAAQANCRRA